MSFQEKNISVNFGSFTFILLFYLLRLLQLTRNGNFDSTHLFRLWGTIILLAIFFTIAATILTHILSAIVEVVRTGNKEPEIEKMADERDQIIDLRGTKITHAVASLGTFLAMLSFVFGQPALVMFALLIGAGIIAQLVGDLFRLRLYRQGF
jgi:hypothetical protein